MGDASDHADVVRFMRSETGRKILAKTRKEFQGRWISDISFADDVEGVTGMITFHAGDPVNVILPGLTLGLIREEYDDVLQEEYYRDFPERRPKANEEEDGHDGTS